MGLRGGEERKALVRVCMAVLLVALDYKMEARVGPAGALEGGYAGTVMRGTAMGEGKEENAFRYFLSKLVRPSPRHMLNRHMLNNLTNSTAKKTLHSSSMASSPPSLNTIRRSPMAIYPAASVLGKRI